jgi:hypothetical protein
MAGMASDSALVPVAERERFEQDGYLIIRGALTHDEVLCYRQALDRAYLSAEAERLVAPGGSLHWLSAVARCPQVVGLVDHPATFPYVWSLLGWNIHVYHSHLDVHPPLAAPARSGSRSSRTGCPTSQNQVAATSRSCREAT